MDRFEEWFFGSAVAKVVVAFSLTMAMFLLALTVYIFYWVATRH